VFNRTIAYRDKKVVGVFVRFSLRHFNYHYASRYALEPWIMANKPWKKKISAVFLYQKKA
jgi:hypothetical protein